MSCLVFSLDDNYLIPFRVFIHSLYATYSIPKECNIFILHSNDLSPASILDLSRVLNDYSLDPEFINVESAFSADFPLKKWDHVSLATYYRLFIGELLPRSMSHAVYLDCDMLAVRCVRDIIDLPVSKLIAAVDHCKPSEGLRIWGAKGGCYFQAGLIKIPVSKWKDLDLAKQFLDVIKNDNDRIKWWDQDVLNITLCDQWERIPVWYNLTREILDLLDPDLISSCARIIHFTGPYKPWNSYRPSPFTDHWDRCYHDAFGKRFDRSQFHWLPSMLRKLTNPAKKLFRG